MNPVTVVRLGLSEFRSHPGRALLPGLALLVGVACLVASLMLGDAMVKAVTDGEERTPAAISLVVDRAPGPDTPQPDYPAAQRTLTGQPGIQQVVPVRTASVDLLGVDGRALKEQVTAAIDPEDPALRRFPMAEGQAPAADGEVAVDKVTAYQRDLHPGSRLALADASGHRIEVKVSGILLAGSKAEQPNLVVGPTLAATLSPTTATSQLGLRLAPGADVAAVQAAARTALGPDLRVRTGDTVRATESDAGTLQGLLMLFSILALATSVFVAGATFRSIYLQRQRKTALLRCLGADRGPIIAGNLIEALISGAVAGVIGALLGGVLARVLGWTLDVTGVSPMLGAVQLSPAMLPTIGQLITGVMVAAVLSGVAAVRPAFAAARVSPLAALRTADDATPDRSLVRRRRMRGYLLVGVAVLFALGALATAKTFASPFFALFSAIAATSGVFGSLGPVVVPALGKMFGTVAGKLFGTHVRLASAELGRVPQRAASVAMPLVLASAIVAFTVVTTTSMRDVALRSGAGPKPDVVMSDTGDRALPAQALQAANRPEVRASVTLSRPQERVTVPDRRGGQSPIVLSGADPSALSAYLGPVGQVGPGSVVIASWLASSRDLHVGGSLTLNGLPSGARTATIAGIFPEGVLSYTDVVLGDPAIGKASSLMVSLKPGADLNAYRASVNAALPDYPTVQATTATDRSDEVNRNMDLATVLLMVLLSLSVAVAVTGIGTALTISVQERRKELALRRALGVTREGVQGGVVAEAVLLALVGIVGGGVLGLVYGELLMAGFGVYVLPTAQLLPLLVGGAVVLTLAVLASILPARAASKVRPAAGLAAG